MPGRIDVKLAELGITLPRRCRRSPTTCPMWSPAIWWSFPARCRRSTARSRSPARSARRLSVEQGKEAARLCFINVLVHLKAACGGDLDRVKRVVRLGGFIASPSGFHPACAGDEWRLGPRGGGVRRGGPPCAHHDRCAGAARRCRRGGGGDVRDQLGSPHAGRFRHAHADAAPEDRRGSAGRMGRLRRRRTIRSSATPS